MNPTYRVTETGEIGKLIPCPCDNPIILEFKDGVRDTFFLRELESTTHPITSSTPKRASLGDNGQKGRPKGIEQRTIKKMLLIYEFLELQSEPVYRQAIQNAVGFDITRPLMNQQSYSPHTITLESLKIVERVIGKRTWFAWQLTELGREKGVEIITNLR